MEVKWAVVAAGVSEREDEAGRGRRKSVCRCGLSVVCVDIYRGVCMVYVCMVGRCSS